ncbi:hypothetical protein QUA20_22160 [Microcoleus sp. Pol7_A1]|uniref:hypothetical protein n=1 Tax=Microcoleus sp. Pol7_A1 TaxID=2818893 RepID=UPI002FD74E16
MKFSSLSKVNISTRLLCQEAAEPLKQALQGKSLVPEEATALLAADEQRAIHALSKNKALIQEIQNRVQGLPSFHSLLQGDSRNLMPKLNTYSR